MTHLGSNHFQITSEEYRKIPRVLVWGQGLTAEETGSRLEALGYEVIPVNPEDRSRLLKIEGFAGDFRVSLSQTIQPDDQEGGKGESEKKWTERVGAIVFAPELVSDKDLFEYRSAPSSRIIALDEMIKTLSPCSDETQPSDIAQTLSFQNPPPREAGILSMLGPASYVAFLSGLIHEGNVLDMAGILSAALEIRRQYQAQVSIFCRQVKVAEEGLERLYQACRDEGVLFFRFDQEGPELLREGEGFRLRFEDPILKIPLELAPDLLIVATRNLLPPEVRERALSSGIGVDKMGFLQSANIHFLPQISQREGIFIAGPGKGPLPAKACREEAVAAALAVHLFFEGRISDPMNWEVTVDKGLCTLCLTCLRFCPHQAVGWTHRVFIHPLACRRCGICAGECPMDAIQINGYSDEAIGKKLEVIRSRWEQAESDQPRIIIFGCQRSAGVAWEAVQSSEFKVLGNIELISLPCAGKLDPDQILKSFLLGADGVLVLACPEENCRSVNGNSYALERILETRRYLEEAGFNPERIRFENLSSNMEWRLKEIIDSFLEQLAVT